jgi:tetratricopeptide (TPR) repeat protein
MCFYKTGQYRFAISDLLKVVTSEPSYNKFSFYILAMCFEKVNDIVTAVRHISKGLYQFPKFAKGYVLRGNLYNLQQKYEKALSDFRKALALNIDEGAALLGMANSLEKIGDFNTACKVLNQASHFPAVAADALLRRARLFHCQGKIQMALADYDLVLERFPNNSEAYFFKAKSLIEEEKFSDAVLCFEQAIKYDQGNLLFAKAVYYLGYIKIKEKDFYGAIHQFDRCASGGIPDQQALRTYAEGVIFLIKRKFKEAINSFNKIVRKKLLLDEYLSNCYEHLAFAHLSLRLFGKALKYLKTASSSGKLTKASTYNFELAQGYISAEKQEYNHSASFFQKAGKIFPCKSESLILQASLLIEEHSKVLPVQEDILLQAEELVEKAIIIRIDSESSHARGVVRYLLGKFEQALEDAKVCIEKADENIPEHYVFRGLCHAALSNFGEAVNDFSVALQLNDGLEYVYNFRGRCAFLMDDSDLAYMDYQKLVSLNENSPEPYIKTAIVLMHSSSFSGAISSLENANSIEYTVEAALLKIKAFLLQYDVELAINEMNFVIESGFAQEGIRKDREILSFIQKFSNESNKDFQFALSRSDYFLENLGEVFDKKILLWYKGVFLLYLERYEDSISTFQKVVEILAIRSKKLSSEEALAIEEQNCEILYNISLCYLSFNKSKTLEMFTSLSKILNKKHKGQLLFLSALVQLELKNALSAEKLMQEAYLCDPETLTPFLNKQQVIIKPLNTTNVLAMNFPLLQVFENKRVRLRPAICLPKPNLPNIEFLIEDKVLEFFKINKIAPKPEPPWLKRNKGSIMFTDNMVDLEHEPISHVISKVELNPKSKKTAKSGVLFRRGSEEKENEFIDNQELEESEKVSVSDDIPDIILKKIKKACF